ncbi:hypothetical protein NPIL_645151 [Nephila pilipes]|uniref:Uncharacterized protein n=1 Tax=Nephila pilipes TaxID=299642 RepID=A0A8X6PKH0_NEPPI|nr:hypothetical protein NPIL_645151 [Nephila pilipes]
MNVNSQQHFLSKLHGVGIRQSHRVAIPAILISTTRSPSPLQEDITKILNQIIQSVSSHIERSSILEQSTKSSSYMVTPTCVSQQVKSDQLIHDSEVIYPIDNKD